MKIALLGHGKMGRLVEALAMEQGWEIGPKLDIYNNAGGRGVTRAAMQGVNVAIDFSQPDAVLANVEAAARLGIHMVVGTTGWGGELSRVETLVRETDIGLVYGSNFSVGMNVFLQIVEQAAELFAKLPQYDPYLAEQHHRGKKDAPSGTAIRLQERVAAFYPGRAFAIASTRAGSIPGNHQVGFDCEADTILLEHRARNRHGFAEGALLAARWVMDRKGLYDFHKIFPQLMDI